jgi:hypothetical protein
MSRYDIATGKFELIEKDQRGLIEFDSDIRILLNVSKDRYITAFYSKNDGYFYAVLMGNVGEYERTLWKMIMIDKVGYEKYDEACKKFRESLPEDYRRIRIHLK